MSTLKAGDRVEVIAAEENVGYENGDILTITRRFAGGHGAYAQLPNGDIRAVYGREIRLLPPAPDLITIDRAELPEVVDHGTSLVSSGSSTVHRNYDSARMLRSAHERLALADFLEARERQAAAKELAAQALQARRDALATELAPRPCGGDNWYTNVSPGLQRAIDLIIKERDAK